MRLSAIEDKFFKEHNRFLPKICAKRTSEGAAEFLPQPPPSAAPDRISGIFEIASAISFKMGSRYIQNTPPD